jgi:GR25 family glycosyltransferase involved in LPS biosynthesis
MDIDIKSFYENSFVISTDASRLNKFYKTFEAMGWGDPLPELVNGVILENRATTEGCTLSHLKVVRIAKERNLPFCVIFEDDAYPCYGFIKKSLQACKDLPDDANGLLLGYASVSKLRTQKNGLSISDVNGKSYIGSQAYIVMPKWYDKLIELLEDNTIADHTFTKDTGLYFTDKPLFIQHNNSKGLNQPRGGYMVKSCHSVDKYPPPGFPLIEDIIPNNYNKTNSEEDIVDKTSDASKFKNMFNYSSKITTINFVFLDMYSIDEERLICLIQKYSSIASKANKNVNINNADNTNASADIVNFTFVCQNNLDKDMLQNVIVKYATEWFNYSIVTNISDAISPSYTYTCFIDSAYTIRSADTYNHMIDSLLKYGYPELLAYKQFIPPTGVARDRGYNYSYSGTLVQTEKLKSFLEMYPELANITHSIFNIVVNLGLRTLLKGARHTYSNDSYAPGIIDLKYIELDTNYTLDTNKYIEDCRTGFTIIANIIARCDKPSKNLINAEHDLKYIIHELTAEMS